MYADQYPDEKAIDFRKATTWAVIGGIAAWSATKIENGEGITQAFLGAPLISACYWPGIFMKVVGIVYAYLILIPIAFFLELLWRAG